MPKISAPTLAEHQARQRRALLDAGTAILEGEGLAALTPAAVGRRAGLARSSFYQYFGSAAELVAALVEEAFPRANAVLAAALEGRRDPLERIDAYVTTTLGLAGQGAHRLAAALGSAELPAPCASRLRQLHREQAQPLLNALRELEVPDPELTATLIGGLIQAALRRVEHGAAPEETTRRALELIHQGVGGTRRLRADPEWSPRGGDSPAQP